MRMAGPKPLGAVLSSILQELGLGQRIKEMRALEIWGEVVGGQIAKVASAERIDRGKLVVRVSKSTWRNELMFLKKDIIANLNKALGGEIVKDIHFR